MKGRCLHDSGSPPKTSEFALPMHRQLAVTHAAHEEEKDQLLQAIQGLDTRSMKKSSVQ